MVKEKLFTYHVNFRGGTYCSQVNAKNIEESLLKWIERLKIEQKDIKFLGDKIIRQLECEINNIDNKPVLLNGLINIWFSLYSTSNGIFWVHIVQTEKNEILNA